LIWNYKTLANRRALYTDLLNQALKDYNLLLPGVPAAFVSLDSGHVGTFLAPNGGKFSTAAVAFLEWPFRKNETARRMFLDAKSPGSLVADKWNVTVKNM
jgi:hypothetical protein